MNEIKWAELDLANRDEKKVKEISDAVRQTGYQLHLYLGVGFLEKVYENGLKHRLEKKGHDVQQQVAIRVHDEDGFEIGYYEADLVVDKKIIVELKAVKQLGPVHSAQLINYLKATGVKDGMLINFGSDKYEVSKMVF